MGSFDGLELVQYYGDNIDYSNHSHKWIKFHNCICTFARYNIPKGRIANFDVANISSKTFSPMFAVDSGGTLNLRINGTVIPKKDENVIQAAIGSTVNIYCDIDTVLPDFSSVPVDSLHIYYAHNANNISYTNAKYAAGKTVKECMDYLFEKIVTKKK